MVEIRGRTAAPPAWTGALLSWPTVSFATVLPRGAISARRRVGGCAWISGALTLGAVERMPSVLIEFPADDPERARSFWSELLGVDLGLRDASEGEGWQTHSEALAVGVHARGRGPGDTASLPYFAVSDIAEALQRVKALGGSVVHPGENWAVCKDSEGSPFGLAQAPVGA